MVLRPGTAFRLIENSTQLQKELPGRVLQLWDSQIMPGSWLCGTHSQRGFLGERVRTWLNLLGFHSIPGPRHIICKAPKKIWNLYSVLEK